MARFCTLASGSGGNSTYISTNDGDILVDAGISCKALMSAIDEVGDVAKLCAVAITHTHIDHTKGLKTFLKKTKLPLIASTPTLEKLAADDMIPEGIKIISTESGMITAGNIGIDFFETSHDAVGSGGYSIILPDGRRAAVCTDLGVVTETVRQKLCGSNVVLIESNHDVEMLRRGPYAAELKLRILSDKGHLSNVACASELPSLLKSGTNRIILGHISAENNTPDIALSTARASLAAVGAKDGEDYILTTAKPKTVGVTVF